MEKEQGLNVHLHLETANLGSLNIHVQMKNKQIETVFYPENSEVEDILRDNLPTLVANLQAKGYKVNADVAKADNQPGLFRKLIEQNIQDNNISRYTFDIRT
jgi:flagellar hook-length control protein FliK